MKKIICGKMNKDFFRYAEKNSEKKITLMDYFIDTIFEKGNIEDKTASKKSVVFHKENNENLKKVSNL